MSACGGAPIGPGLLYSIVYNYIFFDRGLPFSIRNLYIRAAHIREETMRAGTRKSFSIADGLIGEVYKKRAFCSTWCSAIFAHKPGKVLHLSHTLSGHPQIHSSEKTLLCHCNRLFILPVPNNQISVCNHGYRTVGFKDGADYLKDR